jgi:drug/metabolite transporter (DMT)-like permease
MADTIFVVSVVGLLIFGCASSVSMKVMLQLDAPGYNNERHNYDKPFMQSFLMFFGMMFSLIIAKIWDPEAKGTRPPSSLRQIVIVGIPASFDMVASTLMTFGLIWINVSVFQMLRGSMVIFSTILSIIFLHRKVRPSEWCGIGLAFLALIMIGVAGAEIPEVGGSSDNRATTTQKVMGSLLVILSQLVQGAQIVVEEFVMKDLNIPALEVVGWEGVWGLLITVVIAFPFALLIPGKDPSPLGTSLENFIDSFLQLRSGNVVLCSCIFIVAVLGLNIFGMLITSRANAINRTLLEAARTVLVWITMLICHAANAPFGEIWCDWSFLELGGFAVLFSGMLVYNSIVKLPFFDYPGQVDKTSLLE